MTLELTQHFRENWKKRVGGAPDAGDIRNIIRQSILVQRADLLPNGHPKGHTLNIYWHADRKVIIKVDPFTRRAVTVLSRKNMPDKG